MLYPPEAQQTSTAVGLGIVKVIMKSEVNNYSKMRSLCHVSVYFVQFDTT